MDAASRTTNVGVLASVFFHVGAFNINAENFTVVQLHVQVAVKSDRLIELRGLEVLRDIRVEVVLPRKVTHRADLAVQGQTDPDCVLHCGAVNHRQRPGQPSRSWGHIGVGFLTESLGGAVEHLGLSAQFNVHLNADYRIKPGNGVIIIN